MTCNLQKALFAVDSMTYKNGVISTKKVHFGVITHRDTKYLALVMLHAEHTL